MKKAILVLSMLVATSATLLAGNAADWAKYNTMKGATYGSLSETALAKVQLAEFAKENLGRPDIAGWNYNNAAYEVIKDFKSKTNYDTATAALFAAPKGKRAALRADLKLALKSNEVLLAIASDYLSRAKAVTKNPDVLAKVASN